MNGWPAFVAAPIAICASAASATVYMDPGQAQQAIFPGARMSAVAVPLNQEQRHAIEAKSGVSVPRTEPRLWRLAEGGWFIVDEVMGKHEFITYAVGLNADGSVRGVEILEYRERYGGQIRDAAWRSQFAGKRAGDRLQLDSDIRNISGATLSCRHVTDGIKRLLAMYEVALR